MELRKRWRKAYCGQTMTEYLLIVAAVAIVVMSGFTKLGTAGTALMAATNSHLH